MDLVHYSHSQIAGISYPASCPHENWKCWNSGLSLLPRKCPPPSPIGTRDPGLTPTLHGHWSAFPCPITGLPDAPFLPESLESEDLRSVLVLTAGAAGVRSGLLGGGKLVSLRDSRSALGLLPDNLTAEGGKGCFVGGFYMHPYGISPPAGECTCSSKKSSIANLCH